MSPTTIGITGVSERPVSKPSSLSPLSILRVFFQSCFRRSGSVSMTSRAASTAATAAGGIEALKIIERAWCWMYSITYASPAITPPNEANDLLNVPMIKSTLSSTPKCSAVPRPCSPRTPRACASSTMSRAPYFWASSTIRGSGARSPSMLKSPSTTMSFPAPSGQSRSTRSKSSMSLWRKRRISP